MTNGNTPPAPQHRTAAAVRDEIFQRKMRGLDPDEVYRYLDTIADQIQSTEHEIEQLRADNARLQNEVRRLQGELDDFEQSGDRVNDQVVKMFSQAQLIAEQMVEEVSRDARERIGQAREHERKIVAEAVNAAGEQVRSYATTAQAQMQSIMESFASEVDRLGGAALHQHTPDTPSYRRDPLTGSD